MNEQEFAELSAGYALRALSWDDERSYVDALTSHPEWQAIADADAEAAASLGDAVDDVEPPSHVRDAILARVAATDPSGENANHPDADAAASPAGTPARARRRWGRWAFGLAACVIVLGGAGYGTVSLLSSLNRPAAVVALEDIRSAPDAHAAMVEFGDGGEATAHWSPGLSEAVVVTTGLPSISAEQSFELWFVRGDEPISAGTFEPVEDGSTTALLDGEVRQGDVIAVTIEPAGGSPTGLPTSEPIIAIETG